MSRPEQLRALIAAGNRLAAYVAGLADGMELNGGDAATIERGRDDIDRWRFAAELAMTTLRDTHATLAAPPSRNNHQEQNQCTA